MKIWFKNTLNAVRNFWDNNHTNVSIAIASILDGIDVICNNITRLMVIGIILNIVSSHFYPEFAERFPTLYGWFDGWLQLGEFAIKAALGAINAVFTGTWSEFYTSCNVAFQEMWAQFLNWVSQISF